MTSVRRSRALVVTLLVASPLLSACSGGDQPGSPDPSAAGAPGEAVSAMLVDRKPALKHLKIASCPSGKGELEAAGSVRNRGDEAADYVVTVSWLDEGGSVLETVETTVEGVAPATNERWSASAELDEPAGSCTTTVARGTLP
ncbi:FxLYD domain-containing protein [Nocardioides hwasunensis]|uniref:Ig-like domain-containing protein n=1 Tax=Nocardioides hwasunensis TaxID=397258 RepID=A0ABR8MHR3_9ACTN|nr:FxLYD domain-containing protein [Nocardioides hwasunensis]MBD3915468.1 hypothetical protein [Nocardioides hwasunensis]